MTGARGRLAREPLDDLVRWLERAMVAAALLGLVGLLLPGQAGVEVAVAGVAVVIAAPLLRVVWLEVAWARSGDWRFVVVGLVLLGVIATGAGLALLD